MKLLRAITLLLPFFCFWPTYAFEIEKIGPHLRLTDPAGHIARLGGIEIVETGEAHEWLLARQGQTFSSVQDHAETHDRFGTKLIVITGNDGTTIQEHLLGQGLALCRHDLPPSCSKRWHSAEKRARASGIGVWSEKYPIKTSEANPSTNGYALFYGRILHAQEARRYVYLNFGASWKTDFTIRVPKRAVKRINKSGIDLLALEGRLVEARGFMFEENGPMIEITEAAALEILP